MSQYLPWLDDPIPGRQPGGIGEHERWWVERQEILEQAGYMLRPRFRPGQAAVVDRHEEAIP